MMKIESELLAGIGVSISQSLRGPWYAYVSLPGGWPNYLKDGPKYAAPVQSPQGYYWTDCGPAETEEEARSRACAVIGYVYGQRLLEQVGDRNIPAQLVPGPSAFSFKSTEAKS